MADIFIIAQPGASGEDFYVWCTLFEMHPYPYDQVVPYLTYVVVAIGTGCLPDLLAKPV